MRHVLTIAGSDSGGGAGIQADLKTFAAHGVFGMSAITAVTAQNTCGVEAVFDVPPDMIRAQIDAVFSDIRVDAVKIGMLSQPSVIAVVRDALTRWRPPFVVLDPVMVAKGGHRLLQPDAVEALRALLPLATLVTPNLPEAEVLLQRPVPDVDAMPEAAQDLLRLGARAVLLKGGHLPGEAVDILATLDGQVRLTGPRLEGKHTHGTGCSLSSAVAARLACGESLEEAVRGAKAYVARGIGAGLAIGHGIGPIHHFAELYERAGIRS